MTIFGHTYRYLHGYLVNRPTNFSWVVDNKLAGSGMPVTFGQFLWWVNHNIRSIITIREKPLPSEWLTKSNFVLEYRHFRVDDYKAPQLNTLIDIIEYIESNLKIGKPVVVHCAAGKGRTGLILGSYLLKAYHLKPDDAIKEIRKLRPGSIQSKEQINSIIQYGKYVSSLC